MNFPGSSLYKLRHNLKDYWSVNVSGNWRIIFRFEDGHAFTITELANDLGVSRKTISRIINKKASITPDMALRFSKAFNTSPELWLNFQTNYDLWIANQHDLGLEKIHPLIRT